MCKGEVYRHARPSAPQGAAGRLRYHALRMTGNEAGHGVDTP